MTFKELAVSATIPEVKLKRAFKTGTLSLTKDELAGSGATLHLHPESYAKALKARKASKGTRLFIMKKEIGYPFKHMNGGGVYGGSIWGKIWGGIKHAFKFAKDSGLLSKAADVAIPALTTALGQPELAIPARAGVKALTGVGVDSKDGGRITMSDIKKGAQNALRYAKQKGIITDILDQGEKYLISKSDKPEHHEMIHGVRRGIKNSYGVGVAIRTPVKAKSARFVKGSPEAKEHMAKLRKMRGTKSSEHKSDSDDDIDGGSFRM